MLNATKPPVGVVGLGQMGLAMAVTLSAKGFKVIGCDIDPGRRKICEEKGIETAALPQLADAAEVVLLSLPLAAHVADVVEGADRLLSHIGACGVIVDTSTSDPGTSRRLAERARMHNIGFLDAPVSGGPSGAANGALTIMIGGVSADVEKARPVFEALAVNIIHVGGSGAGNVAKLANNMLVAAHLLTVSEAVRMAESAGVAAANIIDVLRVGSGRSAISEVNYPRWILPETFDSGFTMGLMRKDVRLAEALAAETGCVLPICALAARFWRESASSLDDAEDFNRIVTLAPAAGGKE